MESVDSNARTWCWLAISATAPPLLLPHEAGGGAAAALLLTQDAALLLPHGAALFLSVDEGGRGGGTAIDQLHLFLLLMLGCNCGFNIMFILVSLECPEMFLIYTATKIPFMSSFSGNSAASAPISTFMCL